MSNFAMDNQTDGRYKTLSRLNWSSYPIRICRSMHHCEICSKKINLGERYLDGGYTRRAHHECWQRWSPTTQSQSTEDEGKR